MENPVVVIGGGVIGLLTARELVLAGRDVVVLEQSKIGQESSWAGGGILSPLYPWRYPQSVNCIAEFGQTAYPDLLAELKHVGDFQWEKTGMLVLDHTEIEEAQAWAAKKRGRKLETIDKSRAESIQSGLHGVGGLAIWMPEIAHVRNPRLLKVLAPYLKDKGVAFRENITVKKVTRAVRGGGLVLDTTAGEIRAETGVVCAGAWSGDLLKSTGIRLPIAPVKGQMLAFEPAPGLVKPMIMRNGRYLIPRRDGRILIGSTLEYLGYDKASTEVAKRELRQSAIDMLPALAKLKVEHHWAGLRPGTPDGVPYIGEHPDCPGLYVNAGQFRNGLVMAPGSARLAADLILKRPPTFNPAPYSLS